MENRKFLLISVVVAIATTVTFSRFTGTTDKSATADTSVLQSSATSIPVGIPDENIEATPATTDQTSDKELATLSETARAEVKSIDDYCKTVDALWEQRNSPDMIFADLSGHVGKRKGNWRRFASEKVLEKARERFNETTGGRYKIAYIIQKENRVVGANIMFSSSSGDWTKDVYHYFREDGSLAHVLSHFGTFIGPYKFEQRQYFDRNGSLISKSEEYYDFYADEPLKIKLGDDVTADTADLRDRIDYYVSVNKLPFAHLLPPTAK